MADGLKLQLKQARLGTAPPGSVLTFRVAPGAGFSVNAVLDCDMDPAARWRPIEVGNGQTIEEPLLPTGVYTLQVSIAYRSNKPVDVVMDFSLSKDGEVLKSKQLTFTGQKPDIGRALTIFRIQKP
jgi:hypothetical protein